jgi:hypothetical protein
MADYPKRPTSERPNGNAPECLLMADHGNLQGADDCASLSRLLTSKASEELTGAAFDK